MPDAVPKATATRMAGDTLAGFLRRLRTAGAAEGSGKSAPGAAKRGAARETDQQSALSHLIQGGVLIGVLVLLFVLAGFRG